MATTLLEGQLTWSMTRDEEAYREYKIIHLVRAAATDGPFAVSETPGLPLPGQIWNFDDDTDILAYCWPDMSISIHDELEGDNPEYQYWRVEQKFSTKPWKHCKDQLPGNGEPLLQPPIVSGTFSKYTEEATRAKVNGVNNTPIVNSAHEQVRGPQVEFDRGRPQVRIEYNVATLSFPFLVSMIDRVNATAMWGFSRRCIKLSEISWERKFYGTCYCYFTVTLVFDIREETFDRDIMDEGTKVLNGHWATVSECTGSINRWVLDPVCTGVMPDYTNPTHFTRATDPAGNTTRIPLNGYGMPAEVAIGTGTGTLKTGYGNIHVEYYPEEDFLSLGIPSEIDVCMF